MTGHQHFAGQQGAVRGAQDEDVVGFTHDEAPKGCKGISHRSNDETDFHNINSRTGKVEQGGR
jgi:hypothetical protein